MAVGNDALQHGDAQEVGLQRDALVLGIGLGLVRSDGVLERREAVFAQNGQPGAGAPHGGPALDGTVEGVLQRCALPARHVATLITAAEEEDLRSVHAPDDLGIAGGLPRVDDDRLHRVERPRALEDRVVEVAALREHHHVASRSARGQPAERLVERVRRPSDERIAAPAGHFRVGRVADQVVVP